MITDRELSEFLSDGLPTSTPLRLPEQWLGVHEEGSSTQESATARRGGNPRAAPLLPPRVKYFDS